MNLSVVIPTRNRPQFLDEALQSVAFQGGPECEIIIVDDASTPPVDGERLRAKFGRPLRVVRNDILVNVCVARDQGVQASRGDLILHLDDDDRMADGALRMCSTPFSDDPGLEVLFLNVLGFGAEADGFNQRQAAGAGRIVANAQVKSTSASPGLMHFDKRLFPALLAGVPMAFQRSIVRRNAWNKVNDFRRQLYAQTKSDAGQDALFRVSPLWNESEWALYASVLCSTALMCPALYLQRCAGQGYFSTDRTTLASFDAAIEIMNHLSRATRETREFAPWRNIVRAYTGKAHFDHAYFCIKRGQRTDAIASARRALGAVPSWKSLLLYVRTAGGLSLRKQAGGRGPND